MQIGDLIRRAGQQFGSAPCLIHGQRTVSFADFDRLTDRVGHGLLARGLHPGDRVSVLLPNSIDGVIVYYALAKAGLVRVPLNTRETASEHTYKVEDSGSRGLVFAGEAPTQVGVMLDLDQVTDLMGRPPEGGDRPCDERREADAPLRLAYTGGTTGKPKAVVLTTGSELAEVTNFLVDLIPDTTPQSVMLHAAPITHGSGAFFLPHMVKGAANVVLDKFTPEAFLAAAVEHRATATFMVPTMVSMLLEHPDTATTPLSLRRLCWGGAPMATSVVTRALEVLGPVLAQLYGQAEAPLAITCLQPWEHLDRLGSAGKPYTLVEVDVRDGEGNSLPPGEVGEVMTRGPHTMREYWQRPEATSETIEPDGWLHTGDLGTFDANGYLSLMDRRHDVIISGGYNVYPREVENVLLDHPAVLAAAVVGIPDDKWGEQVSAAVVLRSPVESEELAAHCDARLAGFKRPRRIEFWDALPTSPVGKSLRREVRDLMSNESKETSHV